MIERFLTTEQVANILQVHPFTILKFIKQGRINGVKLGRGYRVQESEVERFLTENSVHRPQKPKKAEGDTHFEVDKQTLKIEHQDGDHYYII